LYGWTNNLDLMHNSLTYSPTSNVEKKESVRIFGMNFTSAYEGFYMSPFRVCLNSKGKRTTKSVRTAENTEKREQIQRIHTWTNMNTCCAFYYILFDGERKECKWKKGRHFDRNQWKSKAIKTGHMTFGPSFPTFIHFHSPLLFPHLNLSPSEH